MRSRASSIRSLTLTDSTGLLIISQTLISLRALMSLAISMSLFLSMTPMTFLPFRIGSCLQLLETIISAIFVISMSLLTVGRLRTRFFTLASRVTLFFLRIEA